MTNVFLHRLEVKTLFKKIYYIVNSIEGDYAYLKREGEENEDLKCVNSYKTRNANIM